MPSVSCGIVDLIINKFAHIGEHVVTPWCSQLRQMWKWSQQGRLHLRGFRPGGCTRPGRLNKFTIAALKAEKKKKTERHCSVAAVMEFKQNGLAFINIFFIYNDVHNLYF